jgi:hypothetical protein
MAAAETPATLMALAFGLRDGFITCVLGGGAAILACLVLTF